MNRYAHMLQNYLFPIALRCIALIFFCSVIAPNILANDLHCKKADLIIFSFNRPMQLYALLESIEKYLTGIEKTVIIYRTTHERFDKGYQDLQRDFPWAHFVGQKIAPHDFKSILMQELAAGIASYVLFAVDDMIVKERANLCHSISLLEKSGAYGFYLRMGKNINANYPDGKMRSLPELREIEENTLAWVFNDKTELSDWKYPHSVDMTIYRKSSVQDALQATSFTNPNTMESNWSALANDTIMSKQGLCYSNSIVVNIPINQVQTEWPMPYMHSWSPEVMLDFFESGLKIDISPFYGVRNNMCHSNYEVRFISRG